MNKPKTKKIIKISIIVLLSVLLIFGVYFVSELFRLGGPIFERTEKVDDWASQFANVPTPNDSVLYEDGYSDHIIGIGMSENNDYGYFWIIKTELTEEELSAHYQPFIDEANAETIGLETMLAYHKIGDAYPISTLYDVDGLDEAVNLLNEQELIENQYYIIYAIKRGRWWSKN